MKNFALLVCFSILMLGCTGVTEDKTTKWPERQLFAEAKAAQTEKDYKRAIELFEKLQSRYPFSQYAQQALLEVAYANHKSGEPDAAIAACDRFIKLHPTNPHVDYAYYLKGLANLKEQDSVVNDFLDTVANQDKNERDASAVQASFDTFKQLVIRFPNSRYAPDARRRMRYLIQSLAEIELHVANYYMERHAYLAAAGRAKYLIEHYPRTSAVSRAVSILIEAYDRLGMHDLRDDAKRVFAKNYAGQPLNTQPTQRERRWWQLW